MRPIIQREPPSGSTRFAERQPAAITPRALLEAKALGRSWQDESH
jgi:hypothetical protein